MSLETICIYFLEKHLFLSFTYFLDCIAVGEHCNLLNILDINSLSDEKFASIFPYSSLFILLIIFFCYILSLI